MLRFFKRAGVFIPALALIAVLAPGCNPEPAGPAIGAIIFQDDQYFQLIQQGMEAKAAELGVGLRVNNSANTLDREISLIDTYLAGQVTALVVAPLSLTSSIPALQRAHERGVPVITYDGYIEADFPASNIRSDQGALGRLTGEAARAFIEKELGGRARVAIVQYMALAPEISLQRSKGFKDEVTKLPGVEIVTKQDAWMAPEATALVENILTANPDVNVIWAANEGGTVGAANAATAANKKNPAHRVYVFGTDMSEQIGGYLLAEDQVLQAVTAQKPFDIGGQAIEAAVKAMHKEPVEKQVALPGVLYSRDDPAGTRAYLESLQAMAK